MSPRVHRAGRAVAVCRALEEPSCSAGPSRWPGPTLPVALGTGHFFCPWLSPGCVPVPGLSCCQMSEGHTEWGDPPVFPRCWVGGGEGWACSGQPHPHSQRLFTAADKWIKSHPKVTLLLALLGLLVLALVLALVLSLALRSGKGGAAASAQPLGHSRVPIACGGESWTFSSSLCRGKSNKYSSCSWHSAAAGLS